MLIWTNPPVKHRPRLEGPLPVTGIQKPSCIPQPIWAWNLCYSGSNSSSCERGDKLVIVTGVVSQPLQIIEVEVIPVLPPTWIMNYGVCFTFKSNSIFHSKTGITRIRGTLINIASFQGGTPEWQRTAPGFRHGWLRFSNSPIYSQYDWVEHNETGSLSARKVTNMSTNLQAFRRLNLGIPVRSGKALGLGHPHALSPST